MRNEQFIVIEGWMVKELGLKGNELLIYAIIYGFSQEEGHTFHGSHGYLAEWINSSRQTVMNALASLIEKDLITKTETVINGVKFLEYQSKIFTGGSQKSLQEGCQKSLHNNIEKITKKDNIVRRIEEYTENEELREALIGFAETRKDRKKPLNPRALDLLLKKLDELGQTDNEKIAILNQSVLKGWQGVFPLKDDGYRPRPATNVGTTGVHFEQEREHNYDDDESLFYDPAGGIV